MEATFLDYVVVGIVFGIPLAALSYILWHGLKQFKRVCELLDKLDE